MATLSLCGYIAREPRAPPVQRHPLNIRPTSAQRSWLEAQRSRRGLALNAVVLLALEQAMAADPLPQPEPNAKP